jgi:hypothetical protein
MGTRDRRVHADIPGDPARSLGVDLQLGEDLRPGAIALPAPEQSIDGFPSVERSEGTTGFSRWGNRVKFQL